MEWNHLKTRRLLESDSRSALDAEGRRIADFASNLARLTIASSQGSFIADANEGPALGRGDVRRHMAKKIRMPFGSRVRSGLNEPARGKKGLEPRPRKRRKKSRGGGTPNVTRLRDERRAR